MARNCLTYSGTEGSETKIPDKTEFDAVLVTEDSETNEFLIAFEVKCYTDLVPEEVNRQNTHLKHFRAQGAYQDFAQVFLISYSNLVNVRTCFKNPFFSMEPFLIITWEDFRNFLRPPFFYLDRDCYLPKSIAEDGTKSNKRQLVKHA